MVGCKSSLSFSLLPYSTNIITVMLAEFCHTELMNGKTHQRKHLRVAEECFAYCHLPELWCRRPHNRYDDSFTIKFQINLSATLAMRASENPQWFTRQSLNAAFDDGFRSFFSLKNASCKFNFLGKNSHGPDASNDSSQPKVESKE
ncbi:uncharacterized protein LOC129303203 isoform X2 [Prosopis cineraria]|uniref:uncharacterized protein LOC129303203 isoform X2 n=1 Tax=Prosopis cineraria TaxID=364024 RepID=UPI0024108B64|nr:uncharacterized protein LOC129303203 isoform X2 [Prosopis cineraria]